MSKLKMTEKESINQKELVKFIINLVMDDIKILTQNLSLKRQELLEQEESKEKNL